MTNEIRYRDGKIDEVVMRCDAIHLERMDNDSWSLVVVKSNKRALFSIFLSQFDVNCEVDENQLQTETLKLLKHGLEKEEELNRRLFKSVEKQRQLASRMTTIMRDFIKSLEEVQAKLYKLVD